MPLYLRFEGCNTVSNYAACNDNNVAVMFGNINQDLHETAPSMYPTYSTPNTAGDAALAARLQAQQQQPNVMRGAPQAASASQYRVRSALHDALNPCEWAPRHSYGPSWGCAHTGLHPPPWTPGLPRGLSAILMGTDISKSV